MFQGSMVAIVTPMNSDGSLDIKSFKSLLDFHIEKKTNGVVVVGTTGEAPTIDFDEHTFLIQEAVNHINGKIPVIAGSGANSTKEAIFLTKKSKELGLMPAYLLPHTTINPIKEACLSILKQLMTVWISLKFFITCHVEPVLISITKQSKI